MKLFKTKISGVFLIELEKKSDSRGFLARTLDFDGFKAEGINFNPQQGYVTKSIKKGTMRGLHYLKVPEKKLTRVIKGAVYEVVVDIRPNSKTYGKWEAFVLKDSDYKMLYMEPGIAHAILTLKDDTELMSFYTPAYKPGNEGGLKYNDPFLAIEWPIKVKYVSDKDLAWEDFHKSFKNSVSGKFIRKINNGIIGPVGLMPYKERNYDNR